jgi:protein-L-isoaspartate(D-aspartate) O-methyltransferase
MVSFQIRSRGISDAATLGAMSRVPREQFVPSAMRSRAYEDGALAIGRGQTISQPYIVARSVAALELDHWRQGHAGETPRVLEVGTGSGYQAAVLAAMGAAVTSIEYEDELAAEAQVRLERLGSPVRTVTGDGGEGYPASAPYAGIVVAAAAPDVPTPLAVQLAADGTLVIPLGSRERQVLTRVRHSDRGLVREALEPCVFVPLRGRYGFS